MVKQITIHMTILKSNKTNLRTFSKKKKNLKQ